jgi:hypothetical protein
MKKEKVLEVKKGVVVAKEKNIAKVEGNSPADIIRMAVSGGADLDKLEKLLNLQERYEANEARKIFASSFATAQANIASVLKTKDNAQTHSKYADLSDIIKSAQPVYTKEGFSVIFYEGVTIAPECIRICADVLHKAGHKETYFYDVPLDGTGLRGNANMTKIHGKSSSTSYGRRYLMCMIWNIPTQDDDGNNAGKPVELIDEKQLNQILDSINELGADLKQFLTYMKLEKVEDMLKSDFPKAMAAIDAKRAKGKK